MPEEQTPQISIDSPKKEFEDHLSLPDNHRIFFSGPFGIGKTYFLKKFFKEHPEYIPIHLYPVNYSVAQNEDVFELIKYDVLYNLIAQPEIFEKIQVDHDIKLAAHISNKIPSLMEGFLNNLEFLEKNEVDHTVVPRFLRLLIPVIDSYKNFSKQTDEALNELKIVDEFRSQIENKLGSIYENNAITQLIYECIGRLKNGGKQVVLIIDDLDRIDPEHIFRILNVFSAHFDQYDFEVDQEAPKNKFGFDKVILVGDYGNIKSVFEHRYGVHADSNGYLDKFYSESVFDYDNEKAIVNFLERVKFYDDDVPLFMSHQLESKCIELLFKIIMLLVEEEKLNLRKLLKYEKNTFERYFPNDLEYKHNLTYVLAFLSHILGGKEECETYINELPDRISLNGERYKEIMKIFFLPVLASGTKRSYKVDGFKFDYTAIQDQTTYKFELNGLYFNGIKTDFILLPIRALMKESIRKFYKQKLLNQRAW
ncbi:MAG: AAA family ATPase [Marinoscillum sp.]